jgi:hypothetical protein
MPFYRIREGKRHQGHKAGDVVEHTEQEADPFLDKLELIQTAEPPVVEETIEAVVEEQKPEHVLENQEVDKEVPKRRNKKSNEVAQ